MKFSLFFPSDKILATGYMVMDNIELEACRDMLESGIFVVRKFKDELYRVTVNTCVDMKVKELMESEASNKLTRAYKILGVRNPIAVNEYLMRISENVYPEVVWGDAIWASAIRSGVYYEIHGSLETNMLDYMITTGMIEYEAYGSYCISRKLMEKVNKNHSLQRDKACSLLKCMDYEAVKAFLFMHGHVFKDGRIMSSKDTSEPIGFLL